MGNKMGNKLDVTDVADIKLIFDKSLKEAEEKFNFRKNCLELKRDLNSSYERNNKLEVEIKELKKQIMKKEKLEEKERNIKTTIMEVENKLMKKYLLKSNE